MTKMTEPMQPIVVDDCGVYRFRENTIVDFLLRHGPFDLNQLARMNFPKHDWQQFAQLIGYSVSGFGDLSYVDQKFLARADRQVEKMVLENEKPAKGT